MSDTSTVKSFFLILTRTLLLFSSSDAQRSIISDLASTISSAIDLLSSLDFNRLSSSIFSDESYSRFSFDIRTLLFTVGTTACCTRSICSFWSSLARLAARPSSWSVFSPSFWVFSVGLSLRLGVLFGSKSISDDNREWLSRNLFDDSVLKVLGTISIWRSASSFLRFRFLFEMDFLKSGGGSTIT